MSGLRIAVAYWRDGGLYPRAVVEPGNDPYLRAMSVMTASLRRVAPHARIELHTNLGSGSEVAELEAAGVGIVPTPFESRMPDGYFRSFSASTYALDVLASLADSADGDEVLLLVDPDVVWLRDLSPLVEQASRAGLVGYPIPYPPDFEDLGTTRRQLSSLIVEMTGRPTTGPGGLVAHLGGELLGGTSDEIRRFAAACSDLWAESLRRFEAGTAPWLHTEEHVYSAAFHLLGYCETNTTTAVRRIWTRPGRLRNVRVDDVERIGWHVLSEKGRGLDRLHAEVVATMGAFEPGISDEVFLGRAARSLGLHPSMTDRLTFQGNRLYARARGKRLGPMPA